MSSTQPRPPTAGIALRLRFLIAALTYRRVRTRRGYDELESFPNKVEIFTASVDGDLRDPAYIMKCARTPTPTHTPAAPLWRSGS